ncbi:GNAT family N-acetyltransferase [Salipiger mucosus]|uniref:Acetyltransferase n=1 Tax=Salipiger mucosus DSM 16094 TaxID=1123237 RepID=S9Q981_9RHOB|nr:GNAT family N-acetyltransferase [Salipiger mucosus]EPX76153.1 Acetyltransferase [Salipiger mucosus DSM 16094]
MTDPVITYTETGGKGRYLARVDGIDAEAELTLSKMSDRAIIVDHTGVPDALRGQGIGAALARRVIEDARAAGQRIVPLCPFFKAYAHRHREELADVIQW